MINGIEVAKGIEWKKEAHNQDSYLDISVSKSKGYEKIPGKKGINSKPIISILTVGSVVNQAVTLNKLPNFLKFRFLICKMR